MAQEQQEANESPDGHASDNEPDSGGEGDGAEWVENEDG
jgi:hypothetical protein